MRVLRGALALGALLALTAGGPLRAALPAAVNPLQPFETSATQALLIDTETGTVLFSKASDDRIAPASLAKLMTVAVVFDAVQSGQLSLDTTFTVSENAWRKGGAPAGGTTMFAKLGSAIKVRDLLRGAIIQSANDACIVLAEGMAGSEGAFTDRMNAEAVKLGLTHSHFANSTGLADPNEYASVSDLATLAEHVVTDFPDLYPIFRETAFTWNGINQTNKNPLIAANVGADGLAAGGTDQTGYGIVGSASRDGERLIAVLSGLSTDRVRADEARKLLDWGFRSFERATLFGPNAVVAEASVFGGDRPTVGLVGGTELDAFVPRGGRDQVQGRVVYDGPVAAPIAKGQQIGRLELSVSGQVIREVPLYAAEPVGVGSLSQRAYDAARELVFGWWR